ncbi:MAG: hypothetical protein V1858_05015 [Candidatus Gottesmanbacteria bacterium]
MMKDGLKQAMCNDGFMVRSHNEDEVKDMIKKHVKDMHQMDITDWEAQEKVMSV